MWDRGRFCVPEYAQFYGIRAQCFDSGEGELPSQMVLQVYEFFEDILEMTVSGADNMLVYLEVSKKVFTFQMEIHGQKNYFSNIEKKLKSMESDGISEIEIDEDTLFITLTLSVGGEAP